MSNLSTTKSIIVIMMKNGDIYYRHHTQEVFDSLITSWTAFKPIEVERDRRKTAIDVAEIRIERKSDILCFCQDQEKKDELTELYNNRIKEWKKRWWNIKPALDHFLEVARDKWLVE